MKGVPNYIAALIVVVSISCVGAGQAFALAIEKIEGLSCDPVIDVPICGAERIACYCVEIDAHSRPQYVCAMCAEGLECDATTVTCVTPSASGSPTIDSSGGSKDTARDNPLYSRNTDAQNPLFCDD